MSLNTNHEWGTTNSWIHNGKHPFHYICGGVGLPYLVDTHKSVSTLRSRISPVMACREGTMSISYYSLARFIRVTHLAGTYLESLGT
jgi:hypothetical protein